MTIEEINRRADAAPRLLNINPKQYNRILKRRHARKVLQAYFDRIRMEKAKQKADEPEKRSE